MAATTLTPVGGPHRHTPPAIMDLARASCAWTGCASIARRLLRTSIITFGMIAIGSASAEPPLHQRIDQAMEEIHPGPEARLCSDGEFLRRVYLDLIGRIPSGTEAREFLHDEAPDKRTRTVDELLSRPEHDQHLANVFDVMLMERRPDKYVKRDEWQSYLLTSFRSEKPLNQLASEILAADGADPSGRGPAKFYLEREGEPNLLTREVGRMFFGMDLQCAQCHDHPNVYDYYQSDYFGLFAFLNRSYLFQPDKKKPAVLAEKAEGEANYKSVFTDIEGTTRPRLPGSIQIPEPAFAKDDAYKVKPDPKKKDIRPVPKFSRREQLARLATDGSNRAFNRNLANRLWAHMMGRGLVHPVDQHHSANPPSHPRLLELLADELPKIGYDTTTMLRQLALSRTYQRSIDLPTDLAPNREEAEREIGHWNQRLETVSETAKKTKQKLESMETTIKGLRDRLPELVQAEKFKLEALQESATNKSELTKRLKESKKVLSDHQSAHRLLSSSIADTTKAAALIDDQALKDSAKALEAHLSKLDAIITQHSKVNDATQTELVAANAEWTQTHAAARSSEEERADAEARLRELQRTLSDVSEERRYQETFISHARNQIRRLRSVVTYAEALAERDMLVAMIKRDSTRMRQLETSIAEFKPKRADLRAELSKVQIDRQASAKQAESTKREHETAATASELISGSLDKATQAASLISDELDLRDLLASLRNKSKTLAEQAASKKDAASQAIADDAKLAALAESTQQALADLTKHLASAEDELARLSQGHGSNVSRLETVKSSVVSARDSLTSAWSKQFSVATLHPLSPEQLAMSLMSATGYLDRLHQSTTASFNKKSPLKPEDQSDPEKVAAHEVEIEKQFQINVDRVIARFVKLFGAASGQPQDDFFATVDQALFLRNGSDLRTWLSPATGSLTARLSQMEDPKVLAEELYLSLLTRMPSEAEISDVEKYLGSPDVKKSDAVVQLAWALATSAEFRFRH